MGPQSARSANGWGGRWSDPDVAAEGATPDGMSALGVEGHDVVSEDPLPVPELPPWRDSSWLPLALEGLTLALACW